MANFLLGFGLGLTIGSLVDCLAIRSLGKKSFWGRSYCDKCKKTLAWYDLFPVVSYLLLKGRCRYCKARISKESLLVEVVLGVIIGLLLKDSFPNPFFLMELSPVLILETLFKVFVVSVLAILFITDLKTGYIPDRISKPASIIALLSLSGITFYKIYLTYAALNTSPIGKYLLPPHSDYFQRHALIAAEPLILSLLSALLITLFFWFIIFITRGRGMGGGDLKLGLFIGLALSFPNSVLAIFLAFILGSLVGVGLILFRKKHFGQTIPFGPFLSLGALLALLWGNEILNWYMRLKLTY